MDPIAGSQSIRSGNGHAVQGAEISPDQALFIAERGGIMTIYRAASVVG